MPIDEADGVFQGGGVKMVALVGALLGFYERGIRRWVNVAGASSGAIVAAYLATGHDARETEARVRAAPFRRFEDFGPGGRILGGAWNLLLHHGLARGEFVRRWIDAELGGRTFAAVKDNGDYRLKLIAADVTRRELLVLPDDLARYRLPNSAAAIDPERFRIADAVRMSMSLPYFFAPVELVHAASGTRSTIIDGGLVSNFPIWLFDVADRDPVRPTFGFRLTGGHGVASGAEGTLARLGWPVKLGLDIFHTAMEASDKRFMSHSTRVRTCLVPALDVATTDFGISQAKEAELIESGRRAASAFLDSFRPEDYVNTYGRGLPAAARA
jgi:NTE family protein